MKNSLCNYGSSYIYSMCLKFRLW